MGATVRKILSETIPPPSTLRDLVSPALDEVVLRALEREPDRRFATALDMLAALEEAARAASARAVGQWVEATARERLAARAACLAEVESGSSSAILRIERLAPLDVARAAATEAPTEISLAVPPPSPKVGAPGAPAAPRARSTRVALLALSAIVLLAVLGTRSEFRFGRMTSHRVEASPTPATENPAVAEVPPVTMGDAPKPPAADVPPPALPSAAPQPPVTSPNIPATHPPPPVQSHGKSSRCTPNYFFDDRGIKHLKPECL
jgi:serine/threonine-protein kinase